MINSKTAISFAGFAAMLSLAAPAHAYLDPATGSILLQVMLGAIASATLFFRTIQYRVKELFARSKRNPSDPE